MRGSACVGQVGWCRVCARGVVGWGLNEGRSDDEGADGVGGIGGGARWGVQDRRCHRRLWGCACAAARRMCALGVFGPVVEGV